MKVRYFFLLLIHRVNIIFFSLLIIGCLSEGFKGENFLSETDEGRVINGGNDVEEVVDGDDEGEANQISDSINDDDNLRGDAQPVVVEEEEGEDVGGFSQGIRIENCLEESSTEFNACIFGKNPVADEGESLQVLPLVNAGSVLSSGLDEELIGLIDVSDLQTYAVHIPGERLENEDFVVDYSLLSDPLVDSENIVRNREGNWKYVFHNEPNFNLLNTNVFFWLNHLAESIKNITGSYYGEGKKIKIIPLYSFHDFGEGISLYRNAAWTGESVNVIIFGVSNPLGVESNGSYVYAPLGFDSRELQLMRWGMPF